MLALYQALRKKDVSHDEAFRGVLDAGAGVAGVSVPARAVAGRGRSRPRSTIGNWPPGSAISSGRPMPDDELRQAAAVGAIARSEGARRSRRSAC